MSQIGEYVTKNLFDIVLEDMYKLYTTYTTIKLSRRTYMIIFFLFLVLAGKK